MVIENPPMARKGDDHVCIGLGCFLLVFPFFSFLFLEILFNECVLLALLQLLLLFEYLKCTPVQLRAFHRL